MKIRKCLAASLMSVLLWSEIGGAAEIAGVRFPERLSAGNEELRLQGVGLLRYRVLIKGYVAALYLGESLDPHEASAAVLEDAPRRLEIEYFWSISAEDFAKATVEGISRNTEPAALESIRGRIDRLNDLYEDVEPGDRYAITYLPGEGTELALNGRRLGVIEGAEFSSAFFGIWLGSQPLDESLRDQLLARG